MTKKGKKGYNKDTVYTWKTNRSTSYMNDIEEIAEYFSTTPEYLLTGFVDVSENNIITEIAKLSPDKKKQAQDFIEFLKTNEEFAQDWKDISVTRLPKPQPE